MNKMDEILDYLKRREQQYAPSVREIAAVVGLSVQTTHHALTVLKERGYINWEPGARRTITVVRAE